MGQNVYLTSELECTYIFPDRLIAVTNEPLCGPFHETLNVEMLPRRRIVISNDGMLSLHEPVHEAQIQSQSAALPLPVTRIIAPSRNRFPY